MTALKKGDLVRLNRYGRDCGRWGKRLHSRVGRVFYVRSDSDDFPFVLWEGRQTSEEVSSGYLERVD